MRMNRISFENLLKTLSGVEIYYNHTTEKDKAEMPFLVYLDNSTTSTFADNQVWTERTSYELHLFTYNRDDQLEERLKCLLNCNRIPYRITDVDFDEKYLIWEVIYEVEV